MPVGPAVEPYTRVLPPQWSVKCSSGGRFPRSLASVQCRWRPLALANTGQLRPVHYQTGRYAVVGCKLQYYASEGCKTCANIAGLLLTFIVLVTGALLRGEQGLRSKL